MTRRLLTLGLAATLLAGAALPSLAQDVPRRVRGTVEGISEADFVAAAQAAKEGCPVSQALAAVDITLDAALA